MKFGFDHVHLVGSDLDASERFYSEGEGGSKKEAEQRAAEAAWRELMP